MPKLIPKIGYSMPMWWLGPKIYNGYVAVSAAGKHFSIHFLDESYIMELKEELPDCTFGKRCVNIKYGNVHAVVIVKQKITKYINNNLNK